MFWVADFQLNVKYLENQDKVMNMIILVRKIPNFMKLVYGEFSHR